ncbi:YdeI/OmpD-associated family protein [Pseudoxanthomonas beigongshangi]
MSQHDPRVDAYIAKSAGFARPILEKLRAIVHETCPQVEETLKWGMPTFMHAGGILCGMAAFKQHASFGFWKHALVVGEGGPRDGMGSFGKMTRLADIPPKKQLVPLIRKAMKLNEEGVKSAGPRKQSAPRAAPELPADFLAALKKQRKALATFEAFSPSQRREYIEWVTEAKREDTRQRRIAQSVEWLAEGKPRNWKYM